jgi:hypothetical protein
MWKIIYSLIHFLVKNPTAVYCFCNYIVILPLKHRIAIMFLFLLIGKKISRPPNEDLSHCEKRNLNRTQNTHSSLPIVNLFSLERGVNNHVTMLLLVGRKYSP